MIRQLNKVQLVYVLVDLIIIGLCFYSSYFLYILRHTAESFVTFYLPNLNQYSLIFMLWALFIVISLNRKGLYFTDRSISIPREVWQVLSGVLYSAILISAAILLTQYKFFSRYIFLLCFLQLSVFLSAWRTIKRLIVRRLVAGGFHNVSVLIIGAGKIGRAILQEIKKNPYWGFNVVGFLDDTYHNTIEDIPILGKLGEFTEVAKKHFVDEVIITLSSEREVVPILMKQAKKMQVGIKIVPENFEDSLPILDVVHLGITPLLNYKEMRPHPAEFALKRLFDFAASLILLLICSPLLLFVAIIVKLSSPGPVIYVQKRMGYKGRIFNFYKFRSMVRDADQLKSVLLDKNEAKGNVIFKMKRDPRVTRIGGFLRRYSLDEIMQLANVLKGDMSLVGPRPFPVEESQHFNSNHLTRLTVKPGITGLAQIRGRSDLSFYRWVKWDLWYVNNWSFLLDMKILLLTIPAIFKARGSY